MAPLTIISHELWRIVWVYTSPFNCTGAYVSSEATVSPPCLDVSLPFIEIAISTKCLSGWPGHTIHLSSRVRRALSEFKSSFSGIVANACEVLLSTWFPCTNAVHVKSLFTVRLWVTSIGWLELDDDVDEILHTWIVDEVSWVWLVHREGKTIACLKFSMVVGVWSTCTASAGLEAAGWPLLHGCCVDVHLRRLGGRAYRIFLCRLSLLLTLFELSPIETFLWPALRKGIVGTFSRKSSYWYGSLVLYVQNTVVKVRGQKKDSYAEEWKKNYPCMLWNAS